MSAALAVKKQDMTSGPLFGKMLAFTVPLMLSSILQLLFSAMDMVVVGQFDSSSAVAAIGTTYSITNLLINLFMGLSIGTSVAVSQGLGARDDEEVSRVVHTSLVVSVVGGACIGLLGACLAKPLLAMMSTPPDLLDKAALYMQIYFLGMPAIALYNFAGAVLRSTGDTKRPLYFLAISGVCNILLNLFFVIVCNMSVAGVALATVISQALAALMVVAWLRKIDSPTRVSLRALRVHGRVLRKIMKIGLPAGLQSTVFALSNVLIQSSINSLGGTVMAGNAAAASLDGFAYVSVNAVHQTTLTFTGQNVGARKPERLHRVMVISVVQSLAVAVLFMLIFNLFGRELVGLYVPDNPAAVPYALTRLGVFGASYALCGLMEMFVGGLRGMGASLMPMLVSVVGVCGFRIVWIYTAFALSPTLLTLYISYPISWLLTAVAHGICYFVVRNRLVRRWQAAEE